MTSSENEATRPDLEIFRVFARPDQHGNTTELGVLAAPSTRLATVYASQIFGRRNERGTLHVVSGGVTTAAPRYERPFSHHALRRVDGYSMGQRLAQARKGEMRHV